MTYRKTDKLQYNFRNKVRKFINETEHLGVFITETWRSEERQKELYKQKLSFLDGVHKKSMHQLGLAVDIAFRGPELYPKDIAIWQRVASIEKKHGMDWGYDLWQWDKPHFQDNPEKEKIKNKKILEKINFEPQGKIFCEIASVAMAFSLFLKNKRGIDKIISPKEVNDIDTGMVFGTGQAVNYLWKKYFPDNKIIKTGPRIMKGKYTFHHFRRAILKNRPLVCQINKWEVSEGKMIKGERVGHFVVCIGFDLENKVLYFENPWGTQHSFSCEYETFEELCGVIYTIQ